MVAGALAGIALTIWKYLAARTPETGGVTYRPQAFPLPPEPVPTRAAADAAAIDPDADGNCPLSHPIKGKTSTGIYHPPGAFAYERTRADRCYRDETAAESDGLRAAKR